MVDLLRYYPEAKIGFDNLPYLRVVYWPFVKASGAAGVQSRVELWDGSHVVALDHATKRVYVIKRRRETRRGIIMVPELPNGGIDPGSTPLKTAKDELLEEAGVVAVDESDWVQLLSDYGMQPIDGLALTNQHAFLLLRGRKIQDPERGETEEVMTVTFNELIAMDNRNAFNDPMGPYFVRRAKDWLGEHRPDLLV